MATTESSESDLSDVDSPTDYLTRNADVVDVDAEKDAGSESWERAMAECTEANVDRLDGVGRFEVLLPDGSSAHDVLLVEDNGGNLIGACDCEGWQYHGTACAHLCVIAQRDVLEDLISRHNEYAEELLGVRDEPDVDVVEETATDAGEVEDVDDVQEATDVDQQVEEPPVPRKMVDSDASSANSAVEPQGSTGETATASADSDPFTGSLPDVPDHLVMEMDGQPYIRRAGYARLARSEGFRLRFEEIVGAHETEWSHAKYRATVLDENGQELASDVGTAHVDVEDMVGAEGNLDELASTRAACRALAWATGYGLTAVEEVAAEKAQRAK